MDRYDDARANAQRLVAMNPNDSTYLGLLKLGVISAKVITGRYVERNPLSKTDAS